MITKNIIHVSTLAAFMVGGTFLLAGCESEGPAERAGEQVDKGVQKAKDAINPPGPMEKAGRCRRQGNGQIGVRALRFRVARERLRGFDSNKFITLSPSLCLRRDCRHGGRGEMIDCAGGDSRMLVAASRTDRSLCHDLGAVHGLGFDDPLTERHQRGVSFRGHFVADH